MVRLKWKRTAVAAVAWAGLAWGQSAEMPSPMLNHPRVITVQELGKAAQRCRVLRSWREANGMVAFEVQSISTGERMTVVENSAISARAGSQPGSRMETMTTRIYHWSGATPPPGAPLPPPSAVVHAQPATPRSRTGPVNTNFVARPTPAPAPGTATAAKPAPMAQVPKSPAPADDKVAQQTSDSVAWKSSPKPGVETAQPSDWHKSWGGTGGTGGPPAKPAPVIVLPHADASQPDPLKEPETYTKHAEALPQPRPAQTVSLPKKAEPAPAKVTVAVKPAAPTLAPAPQPLPASPYNPTVALAAPKVVTTPSAMPPAATPAPCSSEPVACVVCPPKRWGLFRKSAPCDVCSNDVCECKAPRGPAVLCCPPDGDFLQRLRNAPTLVDVFRRAACVPTCGPNCTPAPATVTPVPVQPMPAAAPMPVAVERSEPAPLFQGKFQAALAEAQLRREERFQAAAERRAAKLRMEAAANHNKPVVTPVAAKPQPTPEVSVASAPAPLPPQGPVPVLVIPPTRHPTAPAAPPAPKQEVVTVPREDLENAFTEIVPAQAGQRFAKSKPTPEENDESNAFNQPPDETLGSLPGAKRSMVQQYSLPPGAGYVPTGVGTYPYGFNQGTAFGSRPPMEMNTRAMMMHAVYAQNMQPALPVAEAKPQPAVDVPQMLTLLKSALYPSYREWAADNLATLDWQQNPAVVEALVKGAREDAAATVRTGCVRSLGTMRANTPVVLAALHVLKSDPSPQVAQEANRVLGDFAGVRPVSRN